MSPTIEAQALAQEWAEDPDSMPEERREALLDWVRDQAEEWRRDLGPSGMAGWVMAELDVSIRLALVLCEEAGIGS